MELWQGLASALGGGGDNKPGNGGTHLTTPAKKNDGIAGATSPSATASPSTTATAPVRLPPGIKMVRSPGGSVTALGAFKSSRLVGDLRPKPGVCMAPTSSVAEAARLMASARLDAGLVLSETPARAEAGLITLVTLEGIVTDTDIVRKVLAVGLDPETTPVRDVMTKAPATVSTAATCSDALGTMIELRCRHLPVVDENAEGGGRVVGLLDIAKLLFDVMAAAEGRTGATRLLKDALGSDSTGGAAPTQRVLQAATLMSERRAALLVTDASDSVVGVLTPKDVLFKVVAKGLSAETTSVQEVMTQSPDTMPGSATVLQALHQLSTGGYRTVPIVDAANGKPLGVLDVLSLVRLALEEHKPAPPPLEDHKPAPPPRSKPPQQAPVASQPPTGDETSVVVVSLGVGIVAGAIAVAVAYLRPSLMSAAVARLRSMSPSAFAAMRKK